MARLDRTKWRLIAAVSAGNALEWFDFVIYGYLAVTIAALFFPAGDPTAALLLTFLTFGAAFIMRPLGALLVGHYADRRGRKPALLLTVGLMTVGTGIIAVAPTYETVGVAAPLLILAARLLQGLSAGGEFGSATALLAERDPRRRGFFASFQFASQALTAVLATAMAALLLTLQGSAQFSAWGWRLPFLFGLLLGPVAFYIRARITESHEFRKPQRRAPLAQLARIAKAPLLIATGAIVVATVTIYTLIYMPTFASRELGIPLPQGYLAALITSAIQVVAIPLCGALSDRRGRLAVLVPAAALIFCLAPALFALLLAKPGLATLMVFQFGVGLALALYLGALPALLADLFPAAIRTTGLSLSYALAVTAFGGFAPFLNTALIAWSGSRLVPCYYLTGAALLSLGALAAARRRGLR